MFTITIMYCVSRITKRPTEVQISGLWSSHLTYSTEVTNCRNYLFLNLRRPWTPRMTFLNLSLWTTLDLHFFPLHNINFVFYFVFWRVNLPFFELARRTNDYKKWSCLVSSNVKSETKSHRLNEISIVLSLIKIPFKALLY